MDKVEIGTALHKLQSNVRTIQEYIASVCLDEIELNSDFLHELLERAITNINKIKENT